MKQGFDSPHPDFRRTQRASPGQVFGINDGTYQKKWFGPGRAGCRQIIPENR